MVTFVPSFTTTTGTANLSDVVDHVDYIRKRFYEMYTFENRIQIFGLELVLLTLELGLILTALLITSLVSRTWVSTLTSSQNLLTEDTGEIFLINIDSYLLFMKVIRKSQTLWVAIFFECLRKWKKWRPFYKLKYCRTKKPFIQITQIVEVTSETQFKQIHQTTHTSSFLLSLLQIAENRTTLTDVKWRPGRNCSAVSCRRKGRRREEERQSERLRVSTSKWSW